jgi:hypothetical protein
MLQGPFARNGSAIGCTRLERLCIGVRGVDSTHWLMTAASSTSPITSVQTSAPRCVRAVICDHDREDVARAIRCGHLSCSPLTRRAVHRHSLEDRLHGCSARAVRTWRRLQACSRLRLPQLRAVTRRRARDARPPPPQVQPRRQPQKSETVVTVSPGSTASALSSAAIASRRAPTAMRSRSRTAARSCRRRCARRSSSDCITSK